jgi:hypothetical protein
MKKIILLLFAVSLLFSCNQESVLIETVDLSLDISIYDNTDMGVYKGTFTTMDSKSRGVITVELGANNRAFATLDLITGETVTVKGYRYTSGDPINELLFTNYRESDKSLSFNFSVREDGSDPTVSNVLFNSNASDILLLKETTYSAVTPVTGTYTCAACTQPTTFSFTYITEIVNCPQQCEALITLTPQVLFNNVVYSDLGYGTNLVSTGVISSKCDIAGVLQIPSGDIEWEGTLKFVDTECTKVDDGTWVKTNSGTNGTFMTDPC